MTRKGSLCLAHCRQGIFELSRQTHRQKNVVNRNPLPVITVVGMDNRCRCLRMLYHFRSWSYLSTRSALIGLISQDSSSSIIPVSPSSTWVYMKHTKAQAQARSNAAWAQGSVRLGHKTRVQSTLQGTTHISGLPRLWVTHAYQGLDCGDVLH